MSSYSIKSYIRVFLLLKCMINIVLTESCTAHNLLLISFDGFRWNYLNRTNSSTPNFDIFLKHGVHSKRGLKNAFITVTFPNHNTLATGLWEESHGIVANTMYDPKLNEVFTVEDKEAKESAKWFDNGGEPVWVTNQLQNSMHRSGAFMWPGSSAPVKDVTPTKHVNFDRSVKNESRVDTMIDWFTTRHPINLGLLYFEQPDETGHQFGPESEQVTRMIEGLDDVVGYLLKKLKETDLYDKTNIIITSDHGFAESPPNKIINLDKYINPFSYRIFASNPIANILPNEGKTDEIYRNLTKASSNDGHFKVYMKEEIPEVYHYKHNERIMPILIVTEEHYQLQHNGSETNAGGHGWDNSLQDMHPFFLAMGPSFKRGASVEEMQSVDVYPLLCQLLCIDPAPNNGSLQSSLPLLRQLEAEVSVTFGTYIFIFLLIAVVVSVFTVVVCKYRKRTRQQGNIFMMKRGIVDLSTPSARDVHIPLLDDSEEEES